MAMAYLELSQNGGDVGLIGQVGEDLQLWERVRDEQHRGVVTGQGGLDVLLPQGKTTADPKKGLHEAPNLLLTGVSSSP